MDSNIIYLKTSRGVKEKQLSRSIEDIEEMIDELCMAMDSVDWSSSDVKPFVKTVSFLTEIKILARKTK